MIIQEDILNKIKKRIQEINESINVHTINRGFDNGFNCAAATEIEFLNDLLKDIDSYEQ